MDTLISGIIGFAGGFAVAYILASLRNWHEIEEREAGHWHRIHAQDDRIHHMFAVRQALRNRLAYEIRRNRLLNRQRRGALDDEFSWRENEIERQIGAWEKL